MKRLALLFLTLLLSGRAQADSAKPAPFHAGPKVPIQAYGKQNPRCFGWTDGCVLCLRSAGGATQCSTPGIACQPHGLTCKDMRRDP